MVRRILMLATALVVFAHPAPAGKQPRPAGVIAASAGEVVVVEDAGGAWRHEFATGIVGWLYPAPGGRLFAPDLIRSRTTVIDVAEPRIAEDFEGVTLPHFGSSPDRYLVVAGEILLMSYPERALMSRVDAQVLHPWQVVTANGDTVAFILDRPAEGDSAATLVAVDLVGGQVVFRRTLAGDVRRMALSTELGVLALADAASGAVAIVEPSSLLQVAAVPVSGSPRDVCFFAGGAGLVAVSDTGSNGGEVRLWALKKRRREIKLKHERRVTLAAAPERMALSPFGDHRAAIGLATATVAVVDLDGERIERIFDLPGAARDVVWLDPGAPAPLLPQWSDRRPADLSIGSGAR